MPASKKPRKPYRRKHINIRYGFTAADREGLSSILMDVEARSIIKVQWGNCVDEDMEKFQTVMNWCAAVEERLPVDDEEDFQAMKDSLQEGYAALRSIAERFRGQQVDHYVAFGDEQRALITAVEFACRRLRLRSQTCPNLLMEEWEKLLRKMDKQRKDYRQIDKDGSIIEAKNTI